MLVHLKIEIDKLFKISMSKARGVALEVTSWSSRRCKMVKNSSLSNFHNEFEMKAFIRFKSERELHYR